MRQKASFPGASYALADFLNVLSVKANEIAEGLGVSRVPCE
jgi:hypothetical protein